MSGYDIDRVLADWFESDAQAPVPADGVEHALAGARRRTPRPAWLAGAGSHWGWAPSRVGPGVRGRPRPWMGMRWSTVSVLVLALLAVVGGAILVGAARLASPPLPTPRLGQLAYAVDGDIYIADWDGQHPVRIADGLPGGKSGCGSAGYWAEGSMWSPDGRLLAYRSPRSQVDCARPEADTIPTVILSEVDGTVVASFPGVGWLIPWSPDSTRVATWLDLYPSTAIGVYGTDGVRQAVLSLPPSLYGTTNFDHDPAWSPDGSSILIAVNALEQPENSERRKEIWEVPIDGTPPRLVPADDPRSHFYGSLSPDGTRVAYIDDGNLSVTAAAGSETRVLPRELSSSGLDRVVQAPVWSPSGDRIAFSSDVRTELSVISSEMRLMDLATGSVTTLLRVDRGEDLAPMDFSAGGDRILFARNLSATYGRTEATWSTWSVGADGSDLRLVVDDTIDADWQTVTVDPP